jgi:hypothetical protein
MRSHKDDINIKLYFKQIFLIKSISEELIQNNENIIDSIVLPQPTADNY